MTNEVLMNNVPNESEKPDTNTETKMEAKPDETEIEASPVEKAENKVKKEKKKTKKHNKQKKPTQNTENINKIETNEADKSKQSNTLTTKFSNSLRPPTSFLRNNSLLKNGTAKNLDFLSLLKRSVPKLQRLSELQTSNAKNNNNKNNVFDANVKAHFQNKLASGSVKDDSNIIGTDNITDSNVFDTKNDAKDYKISNDTDKLTDEGDDLQKAEVDLSLDTLKDSKLNKDTDPKDTENKDKKSSIKEAEKEEKGEKKEKEEKQSLKVNKKHKPNKSTKSSNPEKSNQNPDESKLMNYKNKNEKLEEILHNKSNTNNTTFKENKFLPIHSDGFTDSNNSKNIENSKDSNISKNLNISTENERLYEVPLKIDSAQMKQLQETLVEMPHLPTNDGNIKGLDSKTYDAYTDTHLIEEQIYLTITLFYIIFRTVSLYKRSNKSMLAKIGHFIIQLSFLSRLALNYTVLFLDQYFSKGKQVLETEYFLRKLNYLNVFGRKFNLTILLNVIRLISDVSVISALFLFASKYFSVTETNKYFASTKPKKYNVGSLMRSLFILYGVARIPLSIFLYTVYHINASLISTCCLMEILFLSLFLFTQSVKLSVSKTSPGTKTVYTSLFLLLTFGFLRFGRFVNPNIILNSLVGFLIYKSGFFLYLFLNVYLVEMFMRKTKRDFYEYYEDKDCTISTTKQGIQYYADKLEH